MKTGDTRYIYRNDLDKACFQHDAAYSERKDLAKRTASDKISRDKAFNTANNPRYNGYERGLASMVYKFFDKKSKNEQKLGDIHRPPSISFDESDDETPLQAISRLYKKNKEQASETSRANREANVSESPLQAILGDKYESYVASHKNNPAKNIQLANELEVRYFINLLLENLKKERCIVLI